MFSLLNLLFFLGTYIFIETSTPVIPGQHAVLQSFLQSPSQHAHCLIFWYDMHGTDIGTLNIWISPQNSTNPFVIWTLSGDQGDRWLQGAVPLPVESTTYKAG